MIAMRDVHRAPFPPHESGTPAAADAVIAALKGLPPGLDPTQ